MPGGAVKNRHPYLTADIHGTGGVIKESPDDFIVSEIPAYQPSGSGEHLYLTIEKRGISTLEAIRRIAGRLKLSDRDVGYAGMKDAVGVTRQTISLQGTKPEVALSLQLDGITVCSVIRHTNKLKPGHLKGNRFQITIRGVAPGAFAGLRRIAGASSDRPSPSRAGHNPPRRCTRRSFRAWPPADRRTPA